MVANSIHVVGLTGKIWSSITEKGFSVTAASLHRLSKADSADFLEVYKGVVQEYPEMLDHLSSGPCIALEIDIPDPNVDVHQAFREFAGPVDPVRFFCDYLVDFPHC